MPVVEVVEDCSLRRVTEIYIINKCEARFWHTSPFCWFHKNIYSSVIWLQKAYTTSYRAQAVIETDTWKLNFRACYNSQLWFTFKVNIFMYQVHTAKKVTSGSPWTLLHLDLCATYFKSFVQKYLVSTSLIQSRNSSFCHISHPSVQADYF